MYFVLKGTLDICEYVDGPVIVNSYKCGQSCGDPQLNLTVTGTTAINVSYGEDLLCFYLSNANYDKIMSVSIS